GGTNTSTDGGSSVSVEQGRRNNQGNTGSQSIYSELEEPPPYHPSMPGSPYTTEAHFDHPLSATWDSGISIIGRSTSTLYSLAQSSNSVHHAGSDGEGTGEERVRERMDGGGMTGSTEGLETGRTDGGGTRYDPDWDEMPGIGPEEIQAPPSYEDSNPPHPPPVYELAVLHAPNPENSGTHSNARVQVNRNSRLGPL
ncbi:hypothetical protein EGW08_005098, partial [Elysia chlorotica]